MTITLEELCELLKERVDPDLLVEELNLSTEDIVDRFEDRIESKFNKLIALVDA
jgi:hypothetical protein